MWQILDSCIPITVLQGIKISLKGSLECKNVLSFIKNTLKSLNLLHTSGHHSYLADHEISKNSGHLPNAFNCSHNMWGRAPPIFWLIFLRREPL